MEISQQQMWRWKNLIADRYFFYRVHNYCKPKDAKELTLKHIQFVTGIQDPDYDSFLRGLIDEEEKEPLKFLEGYKDLLTVYESEKSNDRTDFGFDNLHTRMRGKMSWIWYEIKMAEKSRRTTAPEEIQEIEQEYMRETEGF